jgi:hypothetical protein
MRERSTAASLEDAKSKDAPVPAIKVASLDERAKDEEIPFLEQLLQEGARKLLQAAIENEVIDYIQFTRIRRGKNGQRVVVAMDICRSGRWSVEWVRSGFASHGSGIGTRVAFPVRFCPSICVCLPASML